MDRDLYACLAYLLDHIADKFIIRHSDEHGRPVAACIGESPVDLGHRFHVDGAEDIAFDSVAGAFGLELVHLLLCGIKGKPPVLYRKILDAHGGDHLEGLVDVEVPVGETGNADLDVV